MVNKFIEQKKGVDKEEYDFVDKHGKGWRLKKGESKSDLMKRAEGKSDSK